MECIDPASPSELEVFLQQARTAVAHLWTQRTDYLESVTTNYSLLNESDHSWISVKTVKQIVDEVAMLIDQKPLAMKKQFDQTLSILKSIEHNFAQASANEKAEFCYLTGKTLNALQSTDELSCENDEKDMESINLQQAIQWLTRALKFNPELADAWCELGECRWRQGDFLEAATHFRHALKVCPEHVEAAYQLSMVLRQLPINEHTAAAALLGEACTEKDQEGSETKSNSTVQSPPTRVDYLSESLKMAHRAVQNKPTDGHAWSILGNALLTAFFESFGSITPPPTARLNAESAATGDSRPGGQSQSQITMSRCLAAYAQAAKDRSTALEPNFHYNRGVAWHYQDLFTESLRSWLRAVCLDPHWTAPQTCALRVVRYLLALDGHLSVLNSAPLVTLNDPSSQKKTRGSVSNTNQNKHQSQNPPLDIFISPLTPCLTLLPSSNDDEINVGKHSNTINPSSLAKLLGPYNPSSILPDAATELLSGASRGRQKTGKRSKQSAPVSSTLPRGHQLQFMLFNDLKCGKNMNSVCVGRVLHQLPSDSDLLINVLLVDARGSPLAVRLYNVGKGFGLVRKDILAIPHPFIEECTVSGELLAVILSVTSKQSDPSSVSKLEKELTNLRLSDTASENSTNLTDTTQLSKRDAAEINNYQQSEWRNLHLRICRVPLPDVLVVNGKPIGSSWTAPPVLKTIFFTAN